MQYGLLLWKAADGIELQAGRGMNHKHGYKKNPEAGMFQGFLLLFVIIFQHEVINIYGKEHRKCVIVFIEFVTFWRRGGA